MKSLRAPYDRVVRYALVALAAFALFASGYRSGRLDGIRDERIRQESARSLRDDIAAKRIGLTRYAR